MVGIEQRRDDLLIVLRLVVDLQVVAGRLAGKQGDGADSHHDHQHEHQDEAQAQATQHRPLS